METDEFSLRLQGWRLATAEVLYYIPDHPSLLQSFMWQTLDLAPRLPAHPSASWITGAARSMR